MPTYNRMSLHLSYCRHYGVCGGCSLQHLSYAQQIASKEAVLQKLLPGFSPRFLPIEFGSDEPSRFRQKVAFVFQGGVMGHFERGSNRIVAVEECPVHSDRGNRIAFALRDRLRLASIAPGILRHLIIRTTEDDREAAVMLVVTRNDKSLRRPIQSLLESNDRPDGFFVNINDKPGPFMVGPQTIKIYGRSHVRETVGGLSYLISPEAFFQTNVRAASVLQRCVVESVRGAPRVLDLYCGSGLFSLPLAAVGVRVIGIEENRQAVRDAESNMRLNRIPSDRARFIAARVEDGLEKIARDEWHAVILDPPRQGCPAAVLERVFRGVAPARAVYVSCNPEMLAIELPTILKYGYTVERIDAVDMFPHTDHIETVVHFKRR
jgi:23S rRNA (uracil1939-C5)-methyltransferase